MDLTSYIQSGVLELYALGDLPVSERKEVEDLLGQHAELREELAEIEAGLEALAKSGAVPAPHGSKARLLETVFAGSESHPVLNRSSKLEEYQSILARTDLVPPEDFRNIYGIPIAEQRGVQTMLVWMRHGARPEVHTDLIEKFLVIEGSCEIHIKGEVHLMEPGSYLSIPLHAEHFVKVTSDIPCKFIMQRVAA